VTRRGAVIAVGDELAIGQSLDTNSQRIALALTARGVRVVEHVAVDDDEGRIAGAIRRLSREAELIILTGGLGPTKDDLTRESLAAVLGEKLVEDAGALAFLEGIEERRGRALTPERRRQALRPASARCLANALGTAPGLAATLEAEGRRVEVFCLPGPPREMMPMLEREVLAAFASDAEEGVAIVTRVLRSFGLAEADAAERLGELMDRARNPMVGITASGGIITVRMRAVARAADARAMLDADEALVRERLVGTVFGADNTSLEGVVIDTLRGRGERVITVESCTGGLIGAMLTAMPGSSDVFDGGFVTYANEAKRDAVGVSEELLESHGAVSEPVARAMAEGGLASAVGSRATHCLAVTGIAGPGGGSDEKPVGTVFIARARRQHPTEVRRFLIAGDRDDVRERSAVAALGMLRRALEGGTRTGRLLWEIEGV
jgi:nicotinamide-nucleotide amidase